MILAKVDLFLFYWYLYQYYDYLHEHLFDIIFFSYLIFFSFTFLSLRLWYLCMRSHVVCIHMDAFVTCFVAKDSQQSVGHAVGGGQVIQKDSHRALSGSSFVK